MKLRFLLPALLSIMMNSTMAAPNTAKLEDPGIPGIQIIASDSAEFQALPYAKYAPPGAYAIKNNTNQKITGLSVLWESTNDRVGAKAGPFDGWAGVDPGQEVIVWPNGMISASGKIGEAFGTAVRGFVEYVVLDDGSVYGPAWSWEYLSEGATYRRDLFAAALKAPDVAKFVADQKTKAFDQDRWKRAGWNENIAQAMSDAINDLTQFEFQNSIDTKKKAGLAHLHRHMAIANKHVGRMARKKSNYYEATERQWSAKRAAAIAPEGINPAAWRIYSMFGLCEGPGLSSGGNPLGVRSTIYKDSACNYPPTYAMGDIAPNGMVLSTSDLAPNQTLGWSFSTWCVWASIDDDPMSVEQVKLQPNYWEYDSEYYNKLLTPDSDILPRDRIYFQQWTNFGVKGNYVNTSYSGRVMGIIEPFNLINYLPIKGLPICIASWYKPGELAFLKSIGAVAAPFAIDVLDYVNTHTSLSDLESNGIFNPRYAFGYTTENFVTTYVCQQFETSPTPRKSIRQFDTNRAPAEHILPINYSIAQAPEVTVSCSYPKVVASGGGGGDDACKAGGGNQEECCCCIAAYGTVYFCERQCFGGQEGPCTGWGVGAVNPADLTAAPRQTATQVAFNPAASRVGVERNGTGWLLDRDGTHSIQDNAHSFTPPGGRQPGDVPLSGDWAGTGRSSPGYYRPSTGQWWLDANGNNIYDDGDFHYTFGGVQPTGTPGQPGYVPGDVPVVGDWKGTGQTCIGVFRWGHTWVLDASCNGQWDGSGSYPGADIQFDFGGVVGDVPVAGRWRTPRTDPYGNKQNTAWQVGVVRCYIPPGGTQCATQPFYWIFDSQPAGAYNPDHPVGQGRTGCGISLELQASYIFAQCETPAPFPFGGLVGDNYVAGDWFGTGTYFAGVYRPTGIWLLDNGTQQNSISFGFGGLAGDRPIVGQW
jgi:hypothetical protein